MLSSPGTVAPSAQTDVAPPLVPHGGEIDHVEFLGLPFSLLTQAEVDRRHHRGLRRALSLRGDAERLSRGRGARGAGALAADLPGGLAVGLRQPHRAGAGAARPAGIAAGHRQRPRRGVARRASMREGRPGLPQRILVVGPPHSAEATLHAAYPNLIFDILPAPGGLAHDAELRLAVARACISRRWDIALLCLGCPAQELIAYKLAELGCRSGIALVRRRVDRFFDRHAIARAALAAKAQSGMGLSSGAGARTVVAALSGRIAKNTAHLHRGPLAARALSFAAASVVRRKPIAASASRIGKHRIFSVCTASMVSCSSRGDAPIQLGGSATSWV